MNRRIEKAVVLGAGTMGSRIAAHFANAGLPCILLDIVPPNLPADAPSAERNKIVRAGLEAARKSKPAAFFTGFTRGSDLFARTGYKPGMRWSNDGLVGGNRLK